MRILTAGLLVFGMVFPIALLAQEPTTIIAARRAGQVGERYDGYLGLASASVPTEVRRQVAAINIRRRALYSNLAARQGVPREDVGITAACSLLKRIGPGEYYLLGQGGWRRLAPGQSAAPDYCA